MMSGNLSFQIEHHLYPDLPSNRYAEVAPQVQALFDKYGLTYTTGSMPKQVCSAWHKIVRLSLPKGVARRHDTRQRAEAAREALQDGDRKSQGSACDRGAGPSGAAQPCRPDEGRLTRSTARRERRPVAAPESGATTAGSGRTRDP